MIVGLSLNRTKDMVAIACTDCLRIYGIKDDGMVEKVRRGG